MFGEVMSWVVVGFVFIFAADILHTWDAIDAWLDKKGLLRRRT